MLAAWKGEALLGLEKCMVGVGSRSRLSLLFSAWLSWACGGSYVGVGCCMLGFSM